MQIRDGSGPVVRHLPRVLGWTVAAAAAAVVLLLGWFWLLAPVAALILGLTARLAARMMLDAPRKSLAIAPEGGGLIVDGRDVPVHQVIGGHSYESPRTIRDDAGGLLGVLVPEPEAAPVPGGLTADVSLSHTLETTFGSVDLDLAGDGGGLNLRQLQAYAGLLEQVDAGRTNPAVAEHQDRDPEDYGVGEDLTHPRQGEWAVAQLRRDVHTLIRRVSAGEPLERDWRRGALGLSQVMTEVAAEAYRAHLRFLDAGGGSDGGASPAADGDAAEGTSGDETDSARQHALDHHRETVRRIGETIRESGRAMERPERRAGVVAMLSGLLAGATLGAAYLAAYLDAKTFLSPLLYTFLGLLLVLSVAVVLWGAAHDRRIRRMRYVSAQELSPGTPGGAATAALHTAWWRQTERDAYDPQVRPGDVVRDSPAASLPLIGAWASGPRLLRKTLSSVAVILGLLVFFWGGDREDWFLAGLGLLLAVVSGLLLWVFIGREETLRDRDLGLLAGTLEQMRTDSSFDAPSAADSETRQST